MNDRDLLQEAMDIAAEYRRCGSTDGADLLARHPELAEYLAPLLAESSPSESAEAENATDDDQRLGEFRILRELGRGGMGIVFEAEQISLGRRVALKLLPLHRSFSPRAIGLFRREAQLAAALDHPGIAKVFGLVEADGQLALAMELLRGVSLDQVLEELRTTAPQARRVEEIARIVGATPTWPSQSYASWVAALALQVAEALAHAHEHSIVHRDVKPGNLMLLASGRVVLTDFGLARDLELAGGTQSGEFAGTAEYASPEQLDGSIHSIDGRSDVYSLGVTLFELLVGERPYTGISIAELRERVRSGTVARTGLAERWIPRDLAAIVRQAIQPERADRYASAAAMVEDLKRFLAGRPVAARPVPRRVRVLRWVQRNRLVSAFLVALAATGAGLGYFAWSSSRLQRSYLDLVLDVRLDALWARVPHAFPAWPERREEIAALIREGEALQALVPHFEARLRELRSQAEIRSGHAREAGRVPHPDRERLDVDRAYRERLENEAIANRGAMSEAEREAAQQKIEQLAAAMEARERRLEESDALIFEDEQARLLYDATEKQLLRLLEIEDVILRPLRAREALLVRIESEAPGVSNEIWAGVRDRVKADPRFAGFEVTPQAALVPLGPDASSRLEEFYLLGSGEVVVRGKDRELALDTGSALILVLLPPGELIAPLMDPKPIPIAPLCMAKHELSRAQWVTMTLAEPALDLHRETILDLRNLTASELAKPANGVSADFARELLRRHGLELPREAEWEYACRAGSDASWWSGDDPASLEGVANFQGPQPRSQLLPVYALAPNDFGLVQMHGNVAEWCSDIHRGSREVLCAARGGSWLTPPRSGMSNARNRFAPASATRDLGVRPMYRLRMP
ncbi:MAG: protein kinase [Planctomycetes bacterium]|nr:protein kinase [Planctomycetota bacterium]